MAALVLLGSLGGLAELVLEEHWEDLIQRTPLVLLAAGCVVSGIFLARATRGAWRAFVAVQIAYVASGFLGLWMHYRGNVEFELEMRPSLGGLELFKEAVTGATPSLAPGLMIHLGLLGLLASWVRSRSTTNHL